MKSTIFNTLVLPLALSLVTVITNAQNNSDQFTPLAGTWKMEMNGDVIYETWRIENETTLIGMSYAIKKGDTLVFENMRIMNIENYWVFIPVLYGQDPVLFTLKKSEDQTWIFENKEHDYPQRVGYSIADGSKLLAWIEGDEKGKFKKEEYPMIRVE